MRKAWLILGLPILVVVGFCFDTADTNRIIADGNANAIHTLPGDVRSALNTALSTSDAAIDTIETIDGEQRNKLKDAFPASGGGLPSGPLTVNLVAHWKMDETSGTRSDSWSTNHLTDNNTVGQTDGKINNSANLVRVNQENLTITDNAALSVGGSDFSISFWYRPTTNVDAPIIAKYPADGSSREYVIRILSTAYSVSVGQDDSTQDTVAAGTPSNGVWNHVVFTWDNAAHTGVLYVDNDGGTSKVFAITGNYDDNATFTIGSWSSASVEAHYQNGDIDEVSIWKRKLSGAEVTTLYNGGAGKAFSTY
jgi:hypothetical protein